MHINICFFLKLIVKSIGCCGEKHSFSLKGYSTQKWKFCQHLLTLKLLQTYMSFFLLLNTKEDIQCAQRKSMVPNNCWFQTFLKISPFVFSRRKKLIQVCNNLRVSKCWQNFTFLVEYPFKITHGLRSCSTMLQWIIYISCYSIYTF